MALIGIVAKSTAVRAESSSCVALELARELGTSHRAELAYEAAKLLELAACKLRLLSEMSSGTVVALPAGGMVIEVVEAAEEEEAA